MFTFTFKVVCGICSRAKRDDAGLLPAQERYLGAHIAKVGALATQQRCSFFILSGVYGFIPADEKIPFYDHLLTMREVPDLVRKLSSQLRRHLIDEVHFYTKDKPNWKPYQEALTQATTSLGIRLSVHALPEDS